MYNTLYRQTTCELSPSTPPTKPGLHIFRGEEYIVFPSEFPSQHEVYNMLLDAVRQCVSGNLMRPIHRIIEPVVGHDLKKIFDDPIMYRQVGMEGSVDLFVGRMAVQQTLGRILFDDTIMATFLNDSNNCLVNANSMQGTRVRYYLDHSDVVRVEHKMPINQAAKRYLRNTEVSVEDIDDDFMVVLWDVPFTLNDMSGVFHIAERLGAALTIYYKLLTRFPCSSTALPTFENS